MGAILRWRYGQLALISTAATASKTPAATTTKWAQSGALCQMLRALLCILPRPILSRLVLSLFDGDVSRICGDLWGWPILECVRSKQRNFFSAGKTSGVLGGNLRVKDAPTIP